MHDESPRAHERAVVGIALGVVARHWGQTIRAIRYPEDEQPISVRPLDAIAETSGGGAIAVEHTLHLSFQGQVQDGVRLKKQLQPMVNRVSKTLPRPGNYQLAVHPGALDGVSKLDESEIERWIRSVAPTLGVGRSYRGPDHFITAHPPELQIPLSLYRFQGPPDDARLTLSRFLDADELTSARRTQARNALRKKLPKLAEHCPRGGSRLLVLENPDIQLVNAGNVTEAIRGALSDEGDLPEPEAILLVHTIGPSWWLDWLKDGPEWYPELDRHTIATNPVA